MAARQTVNSRRMEGTQAEEDEGRGSDGGRAEGRFCHKDGGEETMWEKQTGSLAGLPNVWKGPHWVNKALTGEELTTTHHAHTRTHTHTVETTRVSLIIWVRSFNPGWVEWRGLCAVCVDVCVLDVCQRRGRQQSDTMRDRLLKQFNPDTNTPAHTDRLKRWMLSWVLLDGNEERRKGRRKKTRQELEVTSN